ncbi:2'-5' RNA ligase family protein [Nakamurella sp. YIM 132087]|uniref:2'-5' RNA ligase family protein n=1 Tax=Nakamurella alba TaxID=2665158 RepID=A0A7K1FNJ1_9ACTN|nr:2'-5' RNA ligase family protein [Nakamurella alba]MTD14354.1 2'-5' RNA ligase family protein [Nakamurella alba]
MVQSVELLPDAATEAEVRRRWSLLGAAGLPHSGLHTGASNRPHITLAVAPELPANREDDIVRAIIGLPLRLRLGGLLLFPRGRGGVVMALAVTVSAELLTLQDAVRRAVGDDRLGHQAPGEWTPHVTLARRLDPGQVAVALGISGLAADIDGTGVAVRRWDGDAKQDRVISCDVPS